MQDREIREVSSEEIYLKHLAQSIAIAEKGSGEKSFHCKTLNCNGFAFFEDGTPEFYCETCNHVNCLKCESIHENISCADYRLQNANKEAQEETNKYIKVCCVCKNFFIIFYFQQELKHGGEAMDCPKCGMIVMKDEGCDAMTCTVCKTELCWATKGPRWGLLVR